MKCRTRSLDHQSNRLFEIGMLRLSNLLSLRENGQVGLLKTNVHLAASPFILNSPPTPRVFVSRLNAISLKMWRSLHICFIIVTFIFRLEAMNLVSPIFAASHRKQNNAAGCYLTPSRLRLRGTYPFLGPPRVRIRL